MVIRFVIMKSNNLKSQSNTIIDHCLNNFACKGKKCCSHPLEINNNTNKIKILVSLKMLVKIIKKN